MLPDNFLIGILKSFFTLLVILDPFLSLVVFISLTKNTSKEEKVKQALVAVSVAGGLLVIFLFTGLFLLNLLGISLPSFVVAAGVILLILGIQAVLGIELSKKKSDSKTATALVIGTPLLSGPGAMTTIVILSQQYGYWPPLIALVLALLVTWVTLYFSERIVKLLGNKLIEVLSRVLGLILAALAAEFIKDGIVGMIKAFS